MKPEGHPQYTKTVLICACGAKHETRSTRGPEIHISICSACHPFYTGKQKFVDEAGRIEKFNRKYKKAAPAAEAAN